MKKLTFTALWTMALLALSAVTAFADIVPEPEPVRSGGTLLTVLVAAVAVLAVAVIAWILTHRK
jgi:hypothetical protein